LEAETQKGVLVSGRPEPMTKVRWPWVLIGTVSLFIALWLSFFELNRRFPYLKNGSDVVYHAKLKWEAHGTIFPADRGVLRVLIFGNSKVLAGFVPSLFDRMAASQLRVSSFNSGFPGSDLMLPPLKAMCERGQAPDLLLLTLPWRVDPPRRTIFRFILDDHDVIQSLFPFRNMSRDFTTFLLNAPRHGGVVSYYREAEGDETRVIADRGYYLIWEQDRFPGGHLPADFHLASDQPKVVSPRYEGPAGAEVTALNELISRYHIRCYYVPYYLREGEAAEPPGYDQQFAALIAERSSCTVVGPDYYLYPNEFFADHSHLNQAGAAAYTEDLFHLLESKLSPKPGPGYRRALQ
jgi:hypothetical protein